MAATLREHRGAVEADFEAVYGRDLDYELGPEGMGVRKLYNLVKYLPPDAALWRVQQPAESNGETLRTSDPSEIHAFFDDHFR